MDLTQLSLIAEFAPLAGFGAIVAGVAPTLWPAPTAIVYGTVILLLSIGAIWAQAAVEPSSPTQELPREV